MGRVLLVFKNAFRGILYARSLYLWIIAILIVGAELAPQIIFRDNVPNIAALGARQRPLPEGLSADQQKQIQDIRKKEQDLQIQQFQAFRDRN